MTIYNQRVNITTKFHLYCYKVYAPLHALFTERSINWLYISMSVMTSVDPPLQRHRPRHRPAHSAFMDRVDRTLQHQWAREKMDESLQNTVTWYWWRRELWVTENVMLLIIAQADDKVYVLSSPVCCMMWKIIHFVGKIILISVCIN